jgi:mercuric ion binding protein
VSKKKIKMKTQSALLTIAFVLFSFCSFSQTKPAAPVKSETIKVWGNCGMCKGHIEKAAKTAGATAATWNKDTKILTVKYDVAKTTNKQIQEAVAGAGYDTKDLTGNDAAYKNLDECCQYERKADGKKEKTKH